MALHLNFSKKLTRSAIYVACSRATNANGLFIVGTFQKPNAMNPQSLLYKEMWELENEKNIKLTFDEMLEESNDLKILVHNVQSLPKHINYINNDHNQLAMDLLFFVETWTVPSDELKLHNFTMLYRADSNANLPRKPKGLICFKKDKIKCESLNEFCHVEFDDEVKGSLEYATFIVENSTILIIIYKSPNFKITKFKQALINILTRLKMLEKKL